MLRSLLVFSGTDASGKIGLWETNGTGAGTFEVTGVSGGSYLDPLDLTAFGHKVFFEATDASGNPGLWVTGGTAATG